MDLSSKAVFFFQHKVVSLPSWDHLGNYHNSSLSVSCEDRAVMSSETLRPSQLQGEAARQLRWERNTVLGCSRCVTCMSKQQRAGCMCSHRGKEGRGPPPARERHRFLPRLRKPLRKARFPPLSSRNNGLRVAIFCDISFPCLRQMVLLISEA